MQNIIMKQNWKLRILILWQVITAMCSILPAFAQKINGALFLLTSDNFQENQTENQNMILNTIS
jgi:hypothetical protein